MNYTTVGQLSYIYPWYSYYYGNCHGQIGVCSLKFFSTTQPEKYNSQEIKNITIISHEICMVTYFSILFYLHNFVAPKVTLCVAVWPSCAVQRAVAERCVYLTMIQLRFCQSRLLVLVHTNCGLTVQHLNMIIHTTSIQNFQRQHSGQSAANIKMQLRPFCQNSSSDSID